MRKDPRIVADRGGHDGHTIRGTGKAASSRAQSLAQFAETLSDAQWRSTVAPDGRQVGVIHHHRRGKTDRAQFRETGLDYAAARPVTGTSWTGPSRIALYTNPAIAAPIKGAIQNSQSC